MDLVDLRIDFVDLRANFVDLETNFVDLEVGFMGLKMDSGDLAMDCGFGDGFCGVKDGFCGWRTEGRDLEWSPVSSWSGSIDSDGRISQISSTTHLLLKHFQFSHEFNNHLALLRYYIVPDGQCIFFIPSSHEIESENDLLDEDEDVEEENDHESEVPEHTGPVGQKIEASPAPKEAERQLSKKEIRKKELAELEALLADYRVEQEEKGSSDLPSNSFASCIDGVEFSKSFSIITNVTNEKKEGGDQQGEDMEKKNAATIETKSAKKKKKKDKASKEVKESVDQSNNVDATIRPGETGRAGQVEDVSPVDMKEKLKRVALAKKKKFRKETHAAARVAANEVAAQSARIAAAKKKENSHYNQQPMR
ncbi:putative syntaxin-32-like [Capsicum annuum]|nr:putative syntaxin-32-like [Capsicum annuum]KAF3664795.1 putative syntaxin-32-like [Capsicum annuum]